MNKKFFGWMAAVGVLFATACSNDEMLGTPSDPYASGEEVTVSFTISSEGKTPVITRAGEVGGVHYPGSGEWPQISDGSKAKKLIYAVYNDQYELLEQYGDSKYQTENGGHYGQTIMDIDGFPVTISLRLMRGETYNIAFWAQDAECEYYDTNDLTMVEVKYDNAFNNDESRDAFCKTESFTVANDESREVILTRPLAQINVGTAGYDYESAVAIATYPSDDTATDTPETTEEEGEKDQDKTATAFLYSKIELKGVAKYFDVLHNKVLTKDDLETRGFADKEATQNVTYNWARIPAYVNYGDGELPTNYPSIDKLETTIPTTLEGWNSYYRQFKEQFLRVRFYENVERGDNNEPYLPYISKAETSSTLNPQEGKEFSPDTETFKYLSMCYVLVPDYVNKETDTGYKTTLESVTVWVSNDDKGTDALKLGNNITTATSPTVTNVPVQRNWRTNIFGKNLLTLDYEPNILIDANFDGEYNKDGDNEWTSGENSTNYPEKGNDNGNSNAE